MWKNVFILVTVHTVLRDLTRYSSLILMIKVSVFGSEVIWWLDKASPLVFGGNVTLKCNSTRNCCVIGPRKWSAGLQNLAYNEGTINSEKYGAQLKDDYFTLVIKNFSVADFYKTYTCHYGFNQYTSNLTTDIYELQPSIDRLEKYVDLSDGVLQASVYFPAVYPKPVCRLFLDEHNLTSFLNSTVIRNDLFLTVTLSLEYMLNMLICGDIVQITCIIGTQENKIIRSNVSTGSCKNYTDSSTSESTVFMTSLPDPSKTSTFTNVALPILVPIVCIVLIVIAVLCIRKKKTACPCFSWWIDKDKPIVFGGNVTLKCNASRDCCRIGPRKWTGGQRDALLAYNEGTINSNKYDGYLEAGYFTLIIKNFTSEDFNQFYTCIYSFYHYTANLTTDNYEIQPSLNSIGTYLNASETNISAVIYFHVVYPLPICDAFVDTHNLTKFVRISSVKNGLSFNVNISFEYQLQLNAQICGGHLKIMCSIGSKNYTVLKSNTTFEDECESTKYWSTSTESMNDEPKKTTIYVSIVIPILAVIITVLVISVLCVVINKRKSHLRSSFYKTGKKTENRTERTDENHETQSNGNQEMKTLVPDNGNDSNNV